MIGSFRVSSRYHANVFFCFGGKTRLLITNNICGAVLKPSTVGYLSYNWIGANGFVIRLETKKLSQIVIKTLNLFVSHCCLA